MKVYCVTNSALTSSGCSIPGGISLVTELVKWNHSPSDLMGGCYHGRIVDIFAPRSLCYTWHVEPTKDLRMNDPSSWCLAHQAFTTNKCVLVKISSPNQAEIYMKCTCGSRKYTLLYYGVVINWILELACFCQHESVYVAHHTYRYQCAD